MRKTGMRPLASRLTVLEELAAESEGHNSENDGKSGAKIEPRVMTSARR
jgi:hypothetical protein